MTCVTFHLILALSLSVSLGSLSLSFLPLSTQYVKENYTEITFGAVLPPRTLSWKREYTVLKYYSLKNTLCKNAFFVKICLCDVIGLLLLLNCGNRRHQKHLISSPELIIR